MNNFYKNLDGILPSGVSDLFKKELDRAIDYSPTVGIMGKSGAGKSSLINALVGKPVCATSGAGGCTRTNKEITVPVGRREIKFIDFPGLAENERYNDEYAQLYVDKLKDLDIILWLIKIDDRANKNDEEFYNYLVKCYKKSQIIFVLTQADKAEPTREWNYQTYQPSAKQKNIIRENQARIQRDFNVSSNMVVPIACEYYEGKFERFNIDHLVTRIIEQTPAKAKSSFYATVDKENRTKEGRSNAKSAFRSVVSNVLDVVIDQAPVSSLVKTGLRKVKDVAVGVVEKAWDLFFG